MLLSGVDGGVALGVAAGRGVALIHPEDQRTGVFDRAYLESRLRRRRRITGLLPEQLRQVCSSIGRLVVSES